MCAQKTKDTVKALSARRHASALPIFIEEALKAVIFRNWRHYNVRVRLEDTCHSHILRGAWRDRDTNDFFGHCSLIFSFLDFRLSNFVCPSELHPLIWFFFKNSFRKKKIIRKTAQNALAPCIFIVLSIVLKLGTPLIHTQAQNTFSQKF